MSVLSLLFLLLWAFGLGAALLGTLYALRRTGRPTPNKRPASWPSITILKPLKDIEPGMWESLSSFFELEYADFQIIFCVANEKDPAAQLVSKLLERYPKVDACLHVGEAQAGANPKVNNLLLAYFLAKHDLVLISDSNVRVWPQYLQQLATTMTDDVGVVTAVVAGREGKRIGGRLESAYLNTFFARWMHIAYFAGHPCVIGKTMLFRRSAMNRFGGLKNLAQYVAEDYMAGQAMRRLGYRIEILGEPVCQHIGPYSLRSFWSRHLRWGRIRKSQSPLFFLEPIHCAIGSALIGLLPVQQLGVSISQFLLWHFVLWATADCAMIWRLEKKFSVKAILGWVLRELVALPHWVHMASSNRISWRGHRLKILHGGLVET